MFKNGTKYNYNTGEVRIYTTKPKAISYSLMKRSFKFGRHSLLVDEFKNKAGNMMLCLHGVVRSTHNDFEGEIICIRRRFIDEIQSLVIRGV